jgi:hypothetical protein
MKDMEIKNKVLDEIISMMKDKEVDGLKKKSPKFMAMSVEMKKPEDDKEKLLEALSGDKNEMEPGHELKESPDMENEEELSEETIRKLLEQLKD